MPLLLQIDAPLYPDVLINRAPGVWEYRLYGILVEAWGNYNAIYGKVLQLTPETIPSVRVSRDELVQVDALLGVCKIPGAYYYDPINFILQFNVADYNGGNLVGWRVPWGRHIEIGMIVGICDKADMTRPDNILYAGIPYSPRLDTVPDLSRVRDNTFWGNIAFNEGSGTAHNHDGKFDNVSYKGCLCRIIDVPEGGEATQGTIIYSGIMTAEIHSRVKYGFTIGDKRYALQNACTTETLAHTQYPNLEADFVGKHYPIAWNTIQNFKPVKLNGLDKTGNQIQFAFCSAPDVLHSPKRVDSIFFKITDSANNSYNVSIIDLCSISLYGVNQYAGAAYFIAYTNTGTYFGQDTTPSVASSDTLKTLAQGATTVQLSGGIANGTVAAGDILFILYHGTVYRWTISAGATADADANVTVSLTAALPVSMTIADIIVKTITHNEDIFINFFGWHNSTAGEDEHKNGIDIVIDMITMFGGFKYNSVYFDLETFAKERVNAVADNRPISYLIEHDNDKTVNDAIKDIMVSCDGCFICKSDSRFSVRILKATGAPSFEIKPYMIIDDTEESGDLSTVCSSVIVNYGIAGDSSNKQQWLDDTREEVIADVQKETNRQPFDTCLETLEAAKKKASYILDLTQNPEFRTAFKIHYDRDIASASAGDYFIAPRDRAGNRSTYEVVDTSVLLLDKTMTITGIRKTDILYNDGYIQGALMCDAVMGGSLMSISQVVQ